jgi:hypothetical protein
MVHYVFRDVSLTDLLFDFFVEGHLTRQETERAPATFCLLANGLAAAGACVASIS